MIYLAYYVSTHHHYGESGSTQHEHLVDADVDQFALIRRVNEHYALPETIRSHRGTQHEIAAFATKSKPTYCGGGGGTDYTSYVEIRRAPTLVKTHRAREALWYGRKDAQGKFPADQKFGEWFPITAQQAESYGGRDNYEIEPLPSAAPEQLAEGMQALADGQKAGQPAKPVLYEIRCIGTAHSGWRYQVTLWCGRLAYRGESDYAHHQDAVRAAKATGATPRDDD